MATIMEETQFSSYSAGHLSASYESPSQSNYAVAPIPFRTCGGLSSVPIYDSNLTFNAMYDPNQPIIDIHPDDRVGSNTEAPPELAYSTQLTPHHILTQVQQGRFKPSFSAPATPESAPFKYLPPGAFHTKPLMRRSSNIPLAQSTMPVLKMDYDSSMQMMDYQPSYVAVDGNGEYIQDISSPHDQHLQHSMNYESTETFLQPHSQGPANLDVFSPAPTAGSTDYSPSPSLPITPPPSGTFPQQSFYIHQQQMMSHYVSVAMQQSGPVSLSSPSISEDGCCNPRSLFVNPSATITGESFNTPRSTVSSPEQHSDSPEHSQDITKIESPTSDHAMEDVRESTPLLKELSPKPVVAVKAPTSKKSSKRLVGTPPRRRQSSAMSRKSSTVSAPAFDSQANTLDAKTVQSVPVRGRVPKRLKDALAVLAPGSATPERAQSVAMSREQTLMPMQLEPSIVLESRPQSRVASAKSETPLSSPKATTFRNRNSKKRKARRSSTPILPGDQVKLFICNVLGCEKRFRRSEHLKRHARSLHTLEKPYVCNQPDCNKKFSRSDNLNQHLRVHQRNAEEAAGVVYFETKDMMEDKEDDEQKESTTASTPASTLVPTFSTTIAPTLAPKSLPTPEEAPASPIKAASKRRRGPRSVGATAPKRRNRKAPPRAADPIPEAPPQEQVQEDIEA